MPFSNNGDYEALIEQITDVIVARLNGDGGVEQAAMCGCTSLPGYPQTWGGK